jgi:leucyl aminopeptidase (aminopeptidase T)
MSDLLLQSAAEAACDCLAITEADDLLIVSNERQAVITAALAAAGAPRARSTEQLSFPTLTRHGEEPPANVAEAMARASVIFAPTTYSLSHTQARARATERNARIATMVNLSEDTFKRAIAIDYHELAATSRQLATALTRARRCRITTRAGTDVTLNLEGRDGISDDGNLQAPGEWGNLPAGEAYISPLETLAEGTIVFDGALAGHGLLNKPLTVTLNQGCAVNAEGEAADWLLETLDAGGPTGRLIAEFGIGTNPAAILCGQICEDEKVIGTVHIAFGMSASLGGLNQAAVHLDAMMLQPTVELDGQILLHHGRPTSGDSPSEQTLAD